MSNEIKEQLLLAELSIMDIKGSFLESQMNKGNNLPNQELLVHEMETVVKIATKAIKKIVGSNDEGKTYSPEVYEAMANIVTATKTLAEVANLTPPDPVVIKKIKL